jgi:aldose 1-epimerase
MSLHPFGALPDGSAVQEIRLGDGALRASILSYGAVIRDITFDTGDGPRHRVLGFARPQDYLGQPIYFGAVAGRYGNRIAGGRFVIDGQVHQLSINEKGRNHLHGGKRGFSHHVWSVIDHGPAHVTLELVSPHGDEGYPGRLTTRCTYRVTGDNILQITLQAETDAPTIVNLATHSFFNLDGTQEVGGHLLEIPAEAYLPVDGDLIPTGEIVSVAGTVFDFRTPRALKGDVIYDHNFVIARQRRADLHMMARLDGLLTRTRLEIHSTEPGLQFYDGNEIDAPMPGWDGKPYGRHAGICLEPQFFPDSPNHPNFTDAVLRPGTPYQQKTEYRFSAI